ncbi:hypothetical protein [Roseateles sp.]|uniref:hypothetical protein n=1 Tax=Roseateles sp. TaxID=1971397 RepID=UPI0032676A24
MISITLVNLPFWLYAQVYAVERAQINVDLLLAVAVLAWRRIPGIVLLILLWLMDGVVSQSATYFFTTPAAFLDSARFTKEVDIQHLVAPAFWVVCALFCASAIATVRLASARRAEWTLTVVLALILFVLDTANGSSRYAFGDQRLIAMNIAGSPAVTLFHQFQAARRQEPPISVKDDQSIATAASILDWANTHSDGSVWLVLVESMGLINNEELRAAVASPLEVAKRDGGYSVETLGMPFKGATTFGELRALCHLYGSYANMTQQQAAQCMPARLVAGGWTTFALHGFTGRMFDRKDWWRAIGFQSTYFKEDADNSQKLCGGAFTGLCDAPLLSRSAYLLRQPKRFVYTLTLNTHLPLDPHSVGDEMTKVCSRARVSDSVCEISSMHRDVLNEIVTLASQVPKPRPLIVVIGDHAPPFLDRRSRDAFHSATVPAFILRPH